MHHFPKYVGRKHKDLDNLDKKRSYHWELKPDYTTNELDLDEEPAKIKLDFNYKNFFDDDDEARNRLEPNNKGTVSNKKVKKNSIIEQAKINSSFKRSDVKNKNQSVIHKYKDKKPPKDIQKKIKDIKNNSGDGCVTKNIIMKYFDSKNNTDNGNSSLKVNAIKGKAQSIMNTNPTNANDKDRKVSENDGNKEKTSQKEKGKRIKAIKNNSTYDYDNIHIITKYCKRNKTKNHAPHTKVTLVNQTKEPSKSKLFKSKNSEKQKKRRRRFRRSLFVREKSDNESEDEKIIRETLEDDIDRDKRNVMLDAIENAVDNFHYEKSKVRKIDERTKRNEISPDAKLKIGKRITYPNPKININQQQNLKRVFNKSQSFGQLGALKKRDLTRKSGVLGDEIVMRRNRIKPLVSTKSIFRDDRMRNDQITERRQKIDHPAKEKQNLDQVPTNVARAVAMAMEQLKRDKMWGKVFVHVRPSGQLKVMVQETKKMEEEQ